jgi:tetratricopeptide (TPR) repeat protein
VIVVCPNCSTKNRIPEPLDTSKIYRCAKCKTVVSALPSAPNKGNLNMDLNERQKQFFKRQSKPRLPPLVDPPQAGQLIVLDVAEQQRVDNRLKQFFEQEGMKDRVIPEAVLKPVQNALAAQELLELAELRLHAGKLKEAASTCIKVLGLDSGIHSISAWMLLARAYAEYGDRMRAKKLLDTAMEAVGKLQKDLHMRKEYPDQLRLKISALRQQLRCQ